MALSVFSDLDPADRAKFATASRLLSCLVTESLVPAFYQTLSGQAGCTGFVLVLCGEKYLECLDAGDILAIIPLHHPPVFKHEGHTAFGKAVGLLDPLDMIPFVLEYGTFPKSPPQAFDQLIAATVNHLKSLPITNFDSNLFGPCIDPLVLWRKFSVSYKLDSTIEADITEELASAIKWQQHSYENPRPQVSFLSSSIEWEQSIVTGHPTHPMHKLRRFLPPLTDYEPGEYDFLNPCLRFISVPRENTKITYEFEDLLSPLVERAVKAAGKPFNIPEGHIIIPVHDLQTTHIRDKFPDAIIYSDQFSLPLLAQQSLRSVIIPGGFNGLHLKLAIGVRLTSAVRTISPESAYLGPRFSAKVVPALSMDRNIATVARELASIVHCHPDKEIAKHCAALIRECHEDGSEGRGERLIVCTSLVESGHAGQGGDVPALIRVFELHTQEKRIEWLQKFVSIFLRAFLPPMIKNGVAFECHPQNTVARFDLTTKEIKGFIIRDFGGLKVHPETLKATTGIDLDFINDHSIVTNTLEDVYTRMYHTIIHNHFQQLIRVLDLHYNGIGWDIVREEIKKVIPREHALYNSWLGPESKTFPGKCFMRMRMASMYRYHLHAPFPNLILYTGSNHESE